MINSSAIKILAADVARFRRENPAPVTYPQQIKERVARIVADGYSGSQLAVEVGISQSTISKWARETALTVPVPRRLEVVNTTEDADDLHSVEPSVDVILPNGIRLTGCALNKALLALLLEKR